MLWLRLHRSFFSPDAEALLPLRLTGRPGSLGGEVWWLHTACLGWQRDLQLPQGWGCIPHLPWQPRELQHSEIGVHGEIRDSHLPAAVTQHTRLSLPKVAQRASLFSLLVQAFNTSQKFTALPQRITSCQWAQRTQHHLRTLLLG